MAFNKNDHHLPETLLIRKTLASMQMLPFSLFLFISFFSLANFSSSLTFVSYTRITYLLHGFGRLFVEYGEEIIK